MFERCGAGHGDVVPPAQLRSGVLGRPDGLWPAEHIEFGHPAHPAVPACPDHSQPAAVTQHPGDLGDGPARIQPVPRRGDEHSVRARVRNRESFAPARDGADPRGAGGQHRAHPLVRLNRDDVCDPAPQRAGEKSRAGGDIDRDLAVPGDQPVQCLVRGTGPHPVVIVGYLAEGGRPSFTSSHARTLTRARRGQAGCHSSTRLPSGSVTQPNRPTPAMSCTSSATSAPLARNCASIASRSRTRKLSMVCWARDPK